MEDADHTAQRQENEEHAQPPSDAPDGEEGSASEEESAHQAEELGRAFDDALNSAKELGAAFLQLVRAQGRYVALILKEQARLSVARLLLVLHVWVLLIAAWVFLNLGVWRVAAEVDPRGILAPFSVMALHGVVAALILGYCRRLQL